MILLHFQNGSRSLALFSTSFFSGFVFLPSKTTWVARTLAPAG
jgi:hypothetical protein